MSAVLSSPASGIVYRYKEPLVPITLIGIPLAVELACKAYTFFKHPEAIKKKVLHLKKCALETTSKTKICLIILKITVSLLSGAACLCLVPNCIAIPAALTAIQTVGNFVWNENSFFSLKRLHTFIQDSFKARSDESLETFKQRRHQAIKQIILSILIMSVATFALGYVAFQFSDFCSKAKSVWDLPNFLPYQTKAVALLEYFMLSALHLIQAAIHLKKRNGGRGLFHLFSAGLGIAFPLLYLQSGDLRLHHSFTGLLLQLAPCRPLRCLGGVITTDSMLNSIYSTHQNGKITRIGNSWHIQKYDYMNLFWDHFQYALTAMSALCLVSKTWEILFEMDLPMHQS